MRDRIGRMLRACALAAGVLGVAGFAAAEDAGDGLLSETAVVGEAGGGPSLGTGGVDVQKAVVFDDSEQGYKGGRGLITLQGQSGMFLNPTSGTLNRGQLTTQYCVFFQEYGTQLVGHALLVDYGLTDFIDFGGFGTLVDAPGLTPRGVVGGHGRIRILKDESWWPELSIGGIWLDGGASSDFLSRMQGWAAMSKHIDIDPDGILRSVRGHFGYMYTANNELPVPDTQILYAGVELELPYSLYLVGEGSSNDLNTSPMRGMAYAAGLQWKPNSVLGISIAHMRPLGLKDGFYFGIGLNFNL